MNEDVRKEIQEILGQLRQCLIKNGVGMGLEFRKKEICFFDVETYLNEKKFSGFIVCTDDLVK